MPRVSLTGNDAAAVALKQCRPDVAAVYPITPQTEMMHKFSEFVADGEVNTELVTVESEHSAMSACVGASAAGARVGTATASCGLALMWEITYVASAFSIVIFLVGFCHSLKILAGAKSGNGFPGFGFILYAHHH